MEKFYLIIVDCKSILIIITIFPILKAKKGPGPVPHALIHKANYF